MDQIRENYVKELSILTESSLKKLFANQAESDIHTNVLGVNKNQTHELYKKIALALPNAFFEKFNTDKDIAQSISDKFILFMPAEYVGSPDFGYHLLNFIDEIAEDIVASKR